MFSDVANWPTPRVRATMAQIAVLFAFCTGTATHAQVCGLDSRCTSMIGPFDQPIASAKKATLRDSQTSHRPRGTTGESSAPAAGDTCAAATVVAAVPFADMGDTCAAADDYDETCGLDGPGSPDVVYVYTPAADGCIGVSLCSANTNYDTKIEVYVSPSGDPNDCGPYQSGSYRMCSDDGAVCAIDESQTIIDKMFVAAGSTYYIVVDGFGGACGQYELSISDCGCTPFPANDSCAAATGAILSDGVTATLTGDNTCATNECSRLGAPGFSGHTWESFTVPGPEHMDVTLDYCGTTPAFERAWGVMFDGCPCEGADILTQDTFDRGETCTDDNFTLVFYAVPPGTYYYPVMRTTSGLPYAEGPYRINVTGTVVPPPTCGDNVVNQTNEVCDGTDDVACPGQCRVDCTCPAAPTCGDNVVNQSAEECDGTDDDACPGPCRADCTCEPVGEIPAASTWGLMAFTLLLLAGSKVYFGRRWAPRRR